MKAATSTCVDRLLETKEYRIVSAPLMRHVIATSTLSDGAKVLWFSLWELCALEPARRRKLTLGFLSTRLRKSVHTIRRYVNQLQRAGYLVIEEKYDDKGRQLPSLYQTSAPTDVVSAIQKEFPDRKSRRCVDAPVQQADTATRKAICNSDTLTSGSISEEKTGNDIFYVDATSTSLNKSIADNFSENSSNQIHAAVDVTSTMREVSLDSTKKVSKLTEKIMLMHQKAIATKAGSSKQNPTDQSVNSAAEKINTGAKGDGKSAHEWGSRNASQESIPKEDNNKRTSEPGGLRFWIYRQIKQRKAFNSDPWRYVDEIAVAIEKGSLAKFNLTKAMNIALKLIREGRWTAPRFVV